MPAIHFLIKPASSSCNLRCAYCFYQSESSHRSVKSYGFMHDDVLESIVKKGLAYADRECGFAFQGGEPTLIGLPFFEKLVKLERAYNLKKVRISNSLQTNGMLIDESWARFLHDNRFLVGLSLDGPSRIHDLHRVWPDGKGSWSRVMKTARLLDQFAVDYNILAVVTAGTCRSADKIYDFYKKNGFSYLQFINCLAPVGSSPENIPYLLDSSRLEHFLKRLFDRWYADFLQGNYVSIRYFDNLVNMLKGRGPEACSMMGTCRCTPVVEADGSVYPCDFYALDEWKLGNITQDSIEEMLTGKTATRFVKSSENLSPACKACEWFPLCRGGCRRECEPISEAAPRMNVFCTAYRNFLTYAYERLCRIARISL